MTVLALAAVKVRLIPSSNDASRHEGTIIFHARVVTHLLRQYATYAVMAKTNKNIKNLKGA